MDYLWIIHRYQWKFRSTLRESPGRISGLPLGRSFVWQMSIARNAFTVVSHKMRIHVQTLPNLPLRLYIRDLGSPGSHTQQWIGKAQPSLLLSAGHGWFSKRIWRPVDCTSRLILLGWILLLVRVGIIYASSCVCILFSDAAEPVFENSWNDSNSVC